MQSETSRIFHASLDRVMQHPDFFHLFYGRFMASSDEIAAMFKDKDMSRIEKKLQMTLKTVTEHADGEPGLGMYLELLGRIHHRLKITPEQFGLWRNALLETAAECDAEFTPQVSGTWELAIDEVIEKMQDGDDEATGAVASRGSLGQ